MKLTHLSDNSIAIDAAELALFARKKARGNRPFFAPCGEVENQADSFLADVSGEILGIKVISRADMLYREGGKLSVEKIFERRRVTDSLSPLTDPASFAETLICAYLFACREGADGVNVRITYANEAKSAYKTYRADFSLDFMRLTAEALVSRALPFINLLTEKETAGKTALAALAFPYKSIRAPQKEFVTETFRAIKRRERLLVSAPTGVGKTVSALYPALRAVGKGYCDKIFYLTAKTETGIAARQAVADMAKDVPSLRCVTVLAKERLCPLKEVREKVLGNRCYKCERISESGGKSYEERRDGALAELLQSCIIDAKLISAAAEKYGVCPYELSLDASEYAEVVICDYNYVFDPSVRFRRYFAEENDGKFVFLCDEAHNLADRARETYSATLDTDVFLKLYAHGEELFPEEKSLIGAVTDVCAEIGGVAKCCRDEEAEAGDGDRAGYYISPEIPRGFAEPFECFVKIARNLAKDSSELADILEEAINAASDIVSAAALFGDGYRFFGELYNNHLDISLRCLDPSPILDRMLSSAVSSVLFSATLTPMDYFADILGCKNAVTLELDSPYEKENLCLIAYDGVSNRYGDRKNNADEVAELIATVCESHGGNYIVYFSSYEHMNEVYSLFTEFCPEYKTVLQKSNMTYRDRQAFLDSFRTDGEGIVGFCVLGGAFSEGVDLKGKRLCGAIIVGTGLPKLTSSQNILKDYFDTTREDGFSYAYRYPAMIKVMQAVGRVIRSEEDCGIAVLIDDRYGEAETYRLFPKAWSHVRFTKDPFSMSSALMNFWNKHKG